MPYLGLTYKVPLIGGWNNNPNLDLIPPSDFVDISNVNLHNGGVEPRGGCEKVIETPITDAPQVMGIYQFTKENGNSFIMTGTADGKIQKDYTTELKTGLTNDLDIFFETFFDKLYISNGTDISQEWDGVKSYTNDIGTPTACTAALAGAGAGNVENGTHSYKITFVTASGESSGGVKSNVITVVDKASDGQVSLTGIPTGPSSVTSRKIYRTAAGDTGNHKLVAEITDNTTTTYTDNTADGSLGADSPSANLALVPSDWAGAYPKHFIIHGRGSSQRLWAYGCSAYPNKVYVGASGEFDFSDANVITIEILTGHGDGIVGAVEFGERLFVCSKKKTYIIEDTALTTADWGYTAAQWEGGAYSQKLIIKTPTDIIFITEDLEVVSVKAVMQYGDYIASSISRPAFIHTWIADNVDAADIDKFHAIYDPELRAVKIFVMHTALKTQLDTALMFYIDTARWTKHLYSVGQSCSALVNVSTAVWKVYTGGYAGYIYSLESAVLRDAGAIYESSFKTPAYAFDNPRTHKRFDKIWLVLKPIAFETIKAIISIDGRNMSGGFYVVDENGNYLGDENGNYIVSEPTDPWSITVEGAEDVLENYDYFLGSTGIRIQVIFYNEDGYKYFLSQILFDFTDLGANDGY